MKTSENSTSSWQSIIAAFFGFFIMGFVDVVGIATNYIKSDFSLSSTMANLIPMMVFLWFALFSIPTGILMGRIGRKKTVIISLVINTIAMIIPYFSYTFAVILVAFALLGISNTILQVSLNPLVAAMFDKQKTASMLTTGQFVKAISSFLGPIIAGFAASYFGDWKYIFVIFSVTSLLSVILLSASKIHETGFENAPSTFKGVLSLLKNNYILSCFLCILLIVGIDVGMNTSVPELIMKRTGLELSKAGLGTSVYFAARTLGSFLGAFILIKVMPIKYLKLSLYVAIAAFILLLFVNNLWLLFIAVFVVGFACSNVFSIIFSFALQQNPARSNEISALMIMGVSGGAIILPLQGIVNDRISFFAALFILLICLILILFFTSKLKENV
ncbi:MAG: MFS transporter [Bacteroidales bacterium]|nr:MFS transporter [Bacteroidales bacterium]